MDSNDPTTESNSRGNRILGDLSNPKLIWAKGILFVLLGCLSSCLLIVRMSDLIEVVLLSICIWAFCRAYYFAFYVIQHYVDPEYKFDGLLSFLKYAISRPRRP